MNMLDTMLRRMRDEIIRLKRVRVQKVLQRRVEEPRRHRKETRLHDVYRDEARRRARKGLVDR